MTSAADTTRESPSAPVSEAPAKLAPLGRPVSEGVQLATLLDGLLIRHTQIDLDDYRRILAENPRLILTVVHGGLISYIPIGLVLLKATAACDPNRRMVATGHPIVWKIPGLRSLVRTMSASDRHVTFGELASAYQRGEEFDYYAFPESENCLYGDLDRVKPFRFHGFLELSARTGVPLLLIAHRGSEPWYRGFNVRAEHLPLLEKLPDKAFTAFEMNKKAFLDDLRSYKRLNLPLRPRRLSMQVRMELYRPQLDGGLSTSYRTRQKQLAAEGERIRERMQSLYDRLL